MSAGGKPDGRRAQPRCRRLPPRRITITRGFWSGRVGCPVQRRRVWLDRAPHPTGRWGDRLTVGYWRERPGLLAAWGLGLFIASMVVASPVAARMVEPPPD
jgi:hypothetical protein